METKKIDNYSIEVTKTEPQPEPITIKYERSFLEKQLKDILAQKDAFDKQRDLEIQEVQELLNECDKLNIIIKEITPIEKVSL